MLLGSEEVLTKNLQPCICEFLKSATFFLNMTLFLLVYVKVVSLGRDKASLSLLKNRGKQLEVGVSLLIVNNLSKFVVQFSLALISPYMSLET